MPGRSKRDPDLTSRASRSRLKPQGRPHWRLIAEGRYIGYRRHQGDTESGTWVGRLYVGARRYRHRVLGTADDKAAADGEVVFTFRQALEKAQRWCEDEERQLQGLEPRDRRPYTVARAMADYLDWSRAHRKAPHQVEQVTRAHILPALADVELADLTTGRLRRWHQGIAKTPPRLRTAEGKPQRFGELNGDDDRRKRRSTANRALSVLKAALNMAFREGKVLSDDAWRRVRPFKAVDKPKVRWLELEEARRLLNACEPDFRRIVRAALSTGCRYGELCRLKVGDFKATPRPHLVLGDTKSGKGRYVFLTEDAEAFFTQAAAGRSPGEPMFLRSDGNPWATSHQSRRMRAACGIAGIDPPASFHILRHTYASHYLMNGGDLPGLAKQLGHADTRMTTRHYSHLADEWRAEQAKAFGPSFGETTSNLTRLSVAGR